MLSGASEKLVQPSVVSFRDCTPNSQNEALQTQGSWTQKSLEAVIIAREQSKTDSLRTAYRADSSENFGASTTNWLRSVEADEVSSKLSEPDACTWSATIMSHAKLGQNVQAIELYNQMLKTCTKPNGHIFVAVLQACTATAALGKGRLFHGHAIEYGFESDLFVGNALINMYAKCGSLLDARALFDRLPRRDVVTWSSLIAGYAQHGHCPEAIQLFQLMQQDGTEPNRVTYICIVKTCASLAILQQGKGIHSHIIGKGFESDVFIGNTLIDMYSKCGSLEAASSLFNRLPKRDLVTWSALIAGYARHGHGLEALKLFEQMEQDSIEPNELIFVSLLKACSSVVSLEQGKFIHTCIIKSGFGLDLLTATTLVDMYGKCGSPHEAHLVFDRLQKRDVATWSALIAGYTENGIAEVALQLSQRMKHEGIVPDQVTFVCMLKACSSLAALGYGKQTHSQIIESGHEIDIMVGNTLLDMYGKCGSLEDACALFNSMQNPKVVTWNILIGGFALHSNYTMASFYFENMLQGGLKPDEVTFTWLLSACRHLGLVREGCLHYKSMKEQYGIAPRRDHYDSMVDVFGQAGHLNEAEDLLETIPFAANRVGWTSLLDSCRKHGNVHVGRRCFDQIMRVDRGHAAAYVHLANIYSHAGMWEDLEKVKDLRRHANVWKKPAKAVIEIGNQVHAFVVGDKTHSQSDAIYAKLKTLGNEMRKEGYSPQVDLVHDSPSDENKEGALWGHCEKLAIAFGILCTPKGTTIRVSKNFRVCADCHVAMKKISKIEMREIIVTDTYCIHHFKDGACSCPE